MRVHVRMEHGGNYTTIRLESMDDPSERWQKAYLSPLRAALEGEELGLTDVMDRVEHYTPGDRRFELIVYARFDVEAVVTLEEVIARGFEASTNSPME